MAHLKELYAKDLGVKGGKAILDPHYFPIPFDDYITVHYGDNSVPAKSYSYWPTVIKILKKSLGDTKIIQVGSSRDQVIEGVDHFFNNTTLNQSFHIIRHARAHVGADSVPAHIAAVFGVPTVTLYAHTYAQTCNVEWVKDNTKHIQLEPKRKKGECPSFSLNENPKTIDRIKPEKIAESVFKQLGLKKFSSEKTLLIGEKFLHKTVDIIPQEFTQLPLMEDAQVRARLDLVHNENVLVDILTNNPNKLVINTVRPITKTIIENFKPKISKIVYTADEFDEDFLEYLRYSNVAFELNLTDEKKLAQQRNKFFNFDIVLQEPPKIDGKLKKELEKKKINVKFDTGKVYMVGKQQAMTISKDFGEDFWRDAEYFRFYKETS